MLYVGVALAVYAWTLADLPRLGAPESPRDALAALLACAVVAAFWPLTVAWRFLLGPMDVGHSSPVTRVLQTLARLRRVDPFPSAGPRR